MNSKVKSFLELVRLPNLFTAMADIMAAGWIVSGLTGHPFSIELVFLLLASALLYACGLIFNDYFDYEIDKKERPERPLPSGRISKQAALYIGLSLLPLALLLAALVNVVSLVIAVVLTLFILLYDRVAKHNYFYGPLTMGMCRLLNLLLGFSLVTDQLIENWWISLISLVYIFTVTFLARAEVGEGTYPVRVKVMATIVVLSSLAVLLIGDWDNLYISIIAILLFLIWTFKGIRLALKSPTAKYIRKAVGTCIVGLPLLVAALATPFGGLAGYLSVAVFMLASYLFTKLFAVT